uniref:uncharacterized protein LOC100186044 n=1 Tax=Ciona intestinalis TaxID=7719 RepID=UPI000EF4F8FD|nr:uncharacterized protein LOC100186044 [Ciona intestinalis]|eukprot:XP_026692441.1 uncharacterized protein LOC100186044 [Ciona intestinalis]
MGKFALSVVNPCLNLLNASRRSQCILQRTYSAKPKVMTIPSPITSVRNWAFGNMVRGYFNQEFNLKEFVAACPAVMTAIIDHLNNGDYEVLNNLMIKECCDETKSGWEVLSEEDKVKFSSSQEEEFHFFNPVLRMRMEQTGEDVPQLVAHLNIQLSMIYMAKLRDLAEVAQQKSKDTVQVNVRNLVTGGTVKKVEFEREVTREVDGSWMVLSLDQWPSY